MLDSKTIEGFCRATGLNFFNLTTSEVQGLGTELMQAMRLVEAAARREALEGAAALCGSLGHHGMVAGIRALIDQPAPDHVEDARAMVSDKLPALPKPFWIWKDPDEDCGAWCRPDQPVFTADQMHDYARAALAQSADAKDAALPDVDWLSNVIRRADGNNRLGAGALAEAILAAMQNKQEGEA